MEKQYKIFIVIALLLVLALGLKIGKFSIIDDNTLIYTKNITYQNYHLTSLSDRPYGSSMLINDNPELIVSNIINNGEFKIKLSSSNSDNAGNGAIQNVKNILFSRDINISTNKLKELSFSFSSSASYSCGNTGNGMASPSVYLTNGVNDIKLFQAPGVSNVVHPSETDSGVIQIKQIAGQWVSIVSGTSNIISLPNGSYELLLYADIPTSCTSDPGSASSEISISNLNVEYYSQTCTENWQCGAWSSCVGNTQTRTCTDSNNCGTTNNPPLLSKLCNQTDVCPMDAKLCPDGTYVARDPNNNCEFSQCPSQQTTSLCWQQGSDFISQYTNSTDCQNNTIIIIGITIGGLILLMLLFK